MTYEEALKNEDMSAFDLDIAQSICAHCAHWKDCMYSDYTAGVKYMVDEIGVITKCNFYEEE